MNSESLPRIKRFIFGSYFVRGLVRRLCFEEWTSEEGDTAPRTYMGGFKDYFVTKRTTTSTELALRKKSGSKTVEGAENLTYFTERGGR